MIEGKAHKFGDDISTDHITPGRYYHLRSNLPELAKYVLEDADPEFAEIVEVGDIIVAGENFGLGSSREHAPLVIKIAGVPAILAKSFARIFYRNSINVGIIPLTCNTDLIEDGDIVEIFPEEGRIYNRTKDTEIESTKVPHFMMNIIKEGGLAEYIKKHEDLKF